MISNHSSQSQEEAKSGRISEKGSRGHQQYHLDVRRLTGVHGGRDERYEEEEGDDDL